MRVDGREITVSGRVLQPLTRRTSDIVRLVVATVCLAVVVAGSLITRSDWVALEQSISGIVGVLTPAQSDLVYLIYGIAILALPFAILLGLIAGRQWKMLVGYALAAVISFLLLSVSENGIAAPRWHFNSRERLHSVVAQFLDDPRWIAMLAAVLTVSGPWLPARWRRWWWALLLAFVPIHLVVSAVVPARAVLGLAAGFFVGSLVVWVVGTPALVVPLDGAVRELNRRGIVVSSMSVVRPAGPGPLELAAEATRPGAVAGDTTASIFIDLYGPNQRAGGAVRQFWRKLRLRSRETSPLQLSVHRSAEHRGLISIAIDRLGLASSTPLVVTRLERGWILYVRTADVGSVLTEKTSQADVCAVWAGLKTLHRHDLSHGDLRASQVSVIDGGGIRFGGFAFSEFGATEVQMHSDIAQLLATSTDLFGATAAVSAAIDQFGKSEVLAASGRLSKSGVPTLVRRALTDDTAVLKSAREEVLAQTGAAEIQAATITRFSRSQIIQLVLLVALVYVAYPFVSTVPAFFTELIRTNWWWALLGLSASSLTYLGAAAALWACADDAVSFRNLTIMQFANTFAATTTPAGVGGLALSTRFLQKAGLGVVRATTAVALQQAVQVIVHISLLILFTTLAGTSADLSHFVPSWFFSGPMAMTLRM